MNRSACLFCAIAVAAFARPGTARADDDWDSLPAMNSQELQSQRGGFLVAEGIAFDFGAVLRTYVNGRLALETTLTWTPNGAVSQQTVYGDTVTAGAADMKAALASLIQPQIGSGQGLAAAGDMGGSGGRTVLVQQIGLNGLQNLILNTASNQVFRQTADVTVTLANGADFNAAMQASRVSFSLGRSSTDAAVGSLRR